MLWLRNELMETLARISQDSILIIESIITFLRTHYSLELDMLRSKKGAGVVSFALWEVLNREGNPFPMQVIADLTGVNLKEIQAAARDLNISPTYCPPSAFCSKTLSSLSLPFKFRSTVTQAVTMMDYLVCEPRGIIGGVLHEYYTQFLKMRKVKVPALHVKETSPQLSIAESTILSSRKRLSKECLAFIQDSVHDVNMNILKLYISVISV